MLARQRQDLILEQVQRDGGARVSELVERLGVSDMTVRRDIRVLAERGLVAQVHGGAATPMGNTADEPDFKVKAELQTHEKHAIARAAAELVRPGSSVAISGGSTTHAVAQALRDVPRLTVITNSLPVADVMHATARPDLTVVLTGGVRTRTDALVGPVAIAALDGLHVDWLFLGVHGIDERAGLTSPNMSEAETDRAMIASAQRVVVVADHSKWKVIGLAAIATLDAADVLVSDGGLSFDARRVLEARVGQLIIADSPASAERGAPVERIT
jgi:DeoR/GlpR family transcriptional regulator of sugar metabolism